MVVRQREEGVKGKERKEGKWQFLCEVFKETSNMTKLVNIFDGIHLKLQIASDEIAWKNKIENRLRC